MSLDQNLDKVVIIDFGSQFTQLIARRIRELGVFSEIVSHKKIKIIDINYRVKGIILSGVSAGAVCWFEWIFTDSLGDGYKPLRGMNFISGSCTPHAAEKNRIYEFELSIKDKKIPAIFAPIIETAPAQQ